MNPHLLFAAVGIALFALGLHALFARPHVLHKVIAVNVAASGVFLVLAYRPDGGPPDPVTQALVLTGIVVSVAVTAFAAALLARLAALGLPPELNDDDADG